MLPPMLLHPLLFPPYLSEQFLSARLYSYVVLDWGRPGVGSPATIVAGGLHV